MKQVKKWYLTNGVDLYEYENAYGEMVVLECDTREEIENEMEYLLLTNKINEGEWEITQESQWCL